MSNRTIIELYTTSIQHAVNFVLKEITSCEIHDLIFSNYTTLCILRSCMQNVLQNLLIYCHDDGKWIVYIAALRSSTKATIQPSQTDVFSCLTIFLTNRATQTYIYTTTGQTLSIILITAFQATDQSPMQLCKPDIQLPV